MFFYRLQPTSNASHNVYRVMHNQLTGALFKPLTTYLYWRAGRGRSGRIICWTRGRRRQRLRQIHLNHTCLFLWPLCIIALHLQPQTFRLFCLAATAQGWFTYLPATESRYLFTYIFFTIHFCLQQYFLTGNIYFLFQLPRMARLNSIAPTLFSPTSYIKSAGSSGQLVLNDNVLQLVLVRLPSMATKLFSFYSRALLTTILLSRRWYQNTKSGFWRNWGFKGQVRGVAMNPIDHPHGGRTNSIRYPRTPWGLTTKFK